MSNAVLCHVHDCFSIRDSCLKIEDLINKTLEYKYPAVCVSNHGVLSSSYKIYKEAKKHGIKAIQAQEFYFTNDIENKGSNYHLMVYARNQEGWKNLCKLSSLAYNEENFYRKPRINLALLNKYKEGLIVSTACIAALPAQLIINNQIDEANWEINSLHSIFKDNFYLEVQDHNIADEIPVRSHYRNYGREKGIKVIGTTDSHYCNKEDKAFHGIFKNIAYASGEGKDAAFDGDRFHLWSPQEMSQYYNQDELDNTLEIADKCNVEFKHSEYHLPKFDIPNKEQDVHEYLKDMCYKSLKEKGLDTNRAYIDRLEYELNMLHMADLENYILIVSDYMNWCKKENIYTSPGRGSMAGSVVSWLSGTTLIDPIRYELLFERAVNTGRCLQFSFFEE